MQKYRLYQVDSFTKMKFTGNPAGVVSNADGLVVDQMQKIAREMNNSETAFILSPESSDHDFRVRFFTPTTEVPSCGHATIAAFYVKAVENNMDTSQLKQKTRAGILPVDIVRKDDDYKIYMTQGKIVYGNIIEGHEHDMLLSALGITKDDLDDRCPIQIISTGHSKVMIGLTSSKIMNSLSPNLQLLTDLSKRIGCDGYFTFAFEVDSQDILSHGRMFAPAIGINEDPVTGNANGPLGAYLVHYGLVKHNNKYFRFNGVQGEVIGRPGTVEVHVEIKNNEPVLVKVGGNAVIVFRTEIEP
jgi:PhzF family phenazine biosynthesis protein